MGESKRVLVVDDDPNMRGLIESWLFRWGSSVVMAENGTEALTILGGNERYDILITDREMPGMLGEELIRRVRQELKLTLPIILMTGRVESWVRQMASEAGANAFLPKPLEKEELRKTIQGLCGGAQ